MPNCCILCFANQHAATSQLEEKTFEIASMQVLMSYNVYDVHGSYAISHIFSSKPSLGPSDVSNTATVL